MNALALIFGTGFGFVLGWARLADYDVIRAMLLLREPDLYLMMGSAVATAALGARLLRAGRARAWIGGAPIGWTTTRPAANHLLGSVVFGLGWGIAGTCPGPVAVQLGRGQWAAAFTVAGIVAGVALFGYLRERAATPPEAAATQVAPGL